MKNFYGYKFRSNFKDNSFKDNSFSHPLTENDLIPCCDSIMGKLDPILDEYEFKLYNKDNLSKTNEESNCLRLKK